jgi:K+/H+ antiporter YhaU regulatory subunit KhtT
LILAEEFVGRLLRDFWPKLSPFQLLRRGPQFDSGYMIAELNKFDNIVSGGAGKNIDFEMSFVLEGSKVSICDPFVDELTVIHKNIHHYKVLLGDIDSNKKREYLTLGEFEELIGLSSEEINLLKLDIEGSEVNLLGHADVDLNKYDQIVIELHNLHKITEKQFRKRFEVLKKKGYNCIYGDASKDVILQFSNLLDCKLFIITVPILQVAKDIINTIKRVNPNATIIVRCNDINELEDFYNLNISQVVQPEFEASLEMVRQALLHLEVTVEAIETYLDEVRRQKYSLPEKDVVKYTSSLNNASRLLEMYWYHVENDCSMIGKKIKELSLRKKLGVSVIGVYRQNELIQNPDSDFIFESDDMIALIGSKIGKDKFEELFKD